MSTIKDMVSSRAAKGALPTQAEPRGSRAVLRISTDVIDPNPLQPRKTFDETKMKELVNQLRERGKLLQPILVQRHPDNPERYILKAGERRLRAHKVLAAEDSKWSTIEAVLDEQAGDVKELAYDGLNENLVRSNLSALEEGEQYLLLRSKGDNVEEIARRTGQGADRIERCLRIAEAPQIIKDAFTKGVFVPKRDAEGNVVYRRDESGNVVTQKMKVRGEDKEVPEPERVRRVVEDMTVADELVKLYRYLEREKPRAVEAEFRKHLERILSEGWGLRKVQEYVKTVRKTGKTPEKPGAEAVVAGEGSKKADVPATKGGVFQDTAQQLVIHKGRLADLDAGRRAELRQLLEGLLAQLAT